MACGLGYMPSQARCAEFQIFGIPQTYLLEYGCIKGLHDMICTVCPQKRNVLDVGHPSKVPAGSMLHKGLHNMMRTA